MYYIFYTGFFVRFVMFNLVFIMFIFKFVEFCDVWRSQLMHFRVKREVHYAFDVDRLFITFSYVRILRLHSRGTGDRERESSSCNRQWFRLFIGLFKFFDVGNSEIRRRFGKLGSVPSAKIPLENRFSISSIGNILTIQTYVDRAVLFATNGLDK